MNELSKKRWIAFFVIVIYSIIHFSFNYIFKLHFNFGTIANTFATLLSTTLQIPLSLLFLHSFLKEPLEEYGFHLKNIPVQIISGTLLSLIMSFFFYYGKILTYVQGDGFSVPNGFFQNQFLGLYGSYTILFFDFFETLIISIKEEILYRGFLLTFFQKLFSDSLLSILGSGIIFGLSHYPFHHNWYTVLMSSIIGIIYGYLRIKAPEKFTLFSLSYAHFLQNFLLTFNVLI